MTLEKPQTAVVEVTLTGLVTSQAILESLSETGIRSASILRARVTPRTHWLRIQLEGTRETLERVTRTLARWRPEPAAA